MTQRLKFAGLAAVAALTLGMTAACGSDSGSGGETTGGETNGGETSGDAGGSGTLDRLRDEGTIKLAIADERPYSWVGDDGTPQGATIAMHEKIFPEVGIPNIEVVEVDWNSLIPGLNAGRFDAVSAGMSILPDRCAQAAFSDPEIMYTTALMVPEGNPKGLSDLHSVVDAGDVKLAVLAGGIESGYADDLGIGNTMKVDNAQDGMDAVSNGRADAFAMTAISLNWMATNSPDAGVEVTPAFVAVIDDVKQIGAGSTVFRKEDTALLAAYNEALSGITSDVDTYLGLVGDYGFTAENLPPADLTTEQLCSGDLSDLS
ncbi:transporter substrate-binding domain-containing protein [Pseudactinotalea sp. HY158]|uniref:transporter substrate-binding domain-containing protein n=1 Tax=Pseudactinotalea sp. HY158 TaxID=2654547 RepID=UPI00129CF516|nr:transporter substrate-binding domain-containing protein [Pseudactinotalea sp. HY158]QGH69438.1 transporter substrate-binding domain-containing protein [Pseudactinotalea sp. HY158]